MLQGVGWWPVDTAEEAAVRRRRGGRSGEGRKKRDEGGMGVKQHTVEGKVPWQPQESQSGTSPGLTDGQTGLRPAGRLWLLMPAWAYRHINMHSQAHTHTHTCPSTSMKKLQYDGHQESNIANRHRHPQSTNLRIKRIKKMNTTNFLHCFTSVLSCARNRERELSKVICQEE